jgi:hypothetical protein
MSVLERRFLLALYWFNGILGQKTSVICCTHTYILTFVRDVVVTVYVVIADF